jgi:hypothetical protein
MKGDLAMDAPAPDRTAPLTPDPALFWVWLGRATRPKLGWLLTGLGALAIILGYLGLSRRVLITEQMPYLISGGIGGMALIIVGGVFLATEDIRRDLDRVASVEAQVEALKADVTSLREMVDDLHRTLLRRADAVETGPVSSNGAAQSVEAYALPGGRAFHRAGCVMLEGKQRASRATTATIRRRQLEPCALCEPSLPAP